MPEYWGRTDGVRGEADGCGKGDTMFDSLALMGVVEGEVITAAAVEDGVRTKNP